MQDPAFRQALQWAVDNEKIVAIAYSGEALPADTIINRDFYAKTADYQWTPPADQACTFDLEEAKAALYAAGCTDGDGHGTREYKGKDIKLRFFAPSSSPAYPCCAKLITGWF